MAAIPTQCGIGLATSRAYLIDLGELTAQHSCLFSSRQTTLLGWFNKRNLQLFGLGYWILSYVVTTFCSYFPHVSLVQSCSKCDFEGRRYLLLEEINYVQSSEHAIKKSDPEATTKSKNRNIYHNKKRTKEWEFLCSFKDKTQDWFPLKDIMASSPLEVAEFELLVIFRMMNRRSSGGWIIH